MLIHSICINGQSCNLVAKESTLRGQLLAGGMFCSQSCSIILYTVWGSILLKKNAQGQALKKSCARGADQRGYFACSFSGPQNTFNILEVLSVKQWVTHMGNTLIFERYVYTVGVARVNLKGFGLPGSILRVQALWNW